MDLTDALAVSQLVADVERSSVSFAIRRTVKGKAQAAKRWTRSHWGKYLPPFAWVPIYLRSDTRGLMQDMQSALVVGAVGIPQAMADAYIMGVNPVYGLYSLIIPPVVYFILGSSPVLSVGPTAVLALLTGSGVRSLGFTPEDGGDYLRATFLITVFAGIVQAVLGFLRLGSLTSFLSHSVMSGFTSAAGIVIAATQVPAVLGIHSPPHSPYVWKDLYEIWKTAANGIHLPTLLVSIVCMAVIVAGKKWKYSKQLPVPVVLILVLTFISWALDMEAMGFQVVGPIPGPLPPQEICTRPGGCSAPLPPPGLFPWPQWIWGHHILGGLDLLLVLRVSMLIGLLSFLESLAIARTFAQKDGYEIRPNQELRAVGTANIIAGLFFQSVPTTGSFSRTAINHTNGAKSGFSALLSAVVSAVILLTLAPLLGPLPKLSLGAILIPAALSLVDYREAHFLQQVSPKDFWILMGAFMATIVTGLEAGIAFTLALSLGLVLLASMHPHVSSLGIVQVRSQVDLPSRNTVHLPPPGSSAAAHFEADALSDLSAAAALAQQPPQAVRITSYETFAALEEFPEAKRPAKGILILRLHDNLYFANTNFVRAKIVKIVVAEIDRQRKEDPEGEVSLHTIIIDGTAVNHVDVSAIRALRLLKDQLTTQGVQLLLASFSGRCYELLERGWLFMDIEDRMQMAEEDEREQAAAPTGGVSVRNPLLPTGDGSQTRRRPTARQNSHLTFLTQELEVTDLMLPVNNGRPSSLAGGGQVFFKHLTHAVDWASKGGQK